MLFLVAVVGLLGSVILAALGIARGDGGQLERILAIACFAMAASGVLGRLVRRSGARHDASTHAPAAKPPPRKFTMTVGDVISSVVAAPIIALMIGVFVLTLIPFVLVMLPFLAFWWAGWAAGLTGHGAGREVDRSPDHGQLPAPAVV